MAVAWRAKERAEQAVAEEVAELKRALAWAVRLLERGHMSGEDQMQLRAAKQLLKK